MSLIVYTPGTTKFHMVDAAILSEAKAVEKTRRSRTASADDVHDLIGQIELCHGDESVKLIRVYTSSFVPNNYCRRPVLQTILEARRTPDGKSWWITAGQTDSKRSYSHGGRITINGRTTVK